MSETTNKPNDHACNTVASLKEFFTLWIQRVIDFYEERDRRYEGRFQAQDEKTTLALTASKEAIIKAESATEKRFDAVNEFRGTLSDQAATLLPRAEAQQMFTNYDEKIETLKKDVQNLRDTRTLQGGRGAGLKDAWGFVAAAFGIGLTLAMIIFYVLSTINIVGHK